MLRSLRFFEDANVYFTRLFSAATIRNATSNYDRMSFVPQCEQYSNTEIAELTSFIRHSKRLLVLTGAGASTESGIPDYRSDHVGMYARSSARPMTYQTFMSSEDARRRYWTRNYVGWPRFSSFLPNATHEYLRHLEGSGKVGLLVTQNVDRLHHKAGSCKAVELHGTAFFVTCMSCGRLVSRHVLQDVIHAQNPAIVPRMSDVVVRPDGDVDIPPDVIEKFIQPFCGQCSGILKPNIVFFGENVPDIKVQHVYDEMRIGDGILVIGSSLQTYSAYRYVVDAVEHRIPIVIINIGPTRGDHLATLKISSRCGAICAQLLQGHVH